jgi:GNAT superfamily N-acetyltransferase
MWNVVQGDGVITFRNPNTTIAFVRYNKDAEIEYIFVNPQYRKRGHATRLIMMVEQQTGRKAVPQEPISPLGRKLFKMEGNNENRY